LYLSRRLRHKFNHWFKIRRRACGAAAAQTHSLGSFLFADAAACGGGGAEIYKIK
jgi:hypothetical protein